MKYIPEVSFDEEMASKLETNMNNYLRNAPECKVGSYTCHKLDNSDDPFNKNFPAQRFGSRHFFWTEEEEQGLFTFSPGLFTTAPNASQRFANFLADHFGSHVLSLPRRSKILPSMPIATLRNTPTHDATHHSSIWTIRRLQPQK